MSGVFSNKKHQLIIVGIPLILLLFSIFFNRTSEGNLAIKDSFNPYYKPLSNKYQDIFNNFIDNDSTFCASTFQDDVSRELLIFKKSPSKGDVNSDFNLKITLQNNSKDSLQIDITRDAVLYNFNYSAYAVYRTPLPLIDIEKISITQKAKYKNHRVWRSLINASFSPVKKTEEVEHKNVISKEIPNMYNSLFAQTLKTYGINSMQNTFFTRRDSLFINRKKLTDFVSEQESTIAKIANPSAFWKNISAKNINAKSQIVFSGTNSDMANYKLEQFLTNALEFKSVFNVNKLAYFTALSNLFTGSCNDELYLLYNAKTELLEPFFVTSNCLGQKGKYIVHPEIQNENYVAAYINALNEVSKKNIPEDYIRNSNTLEDEITLINKFYPSMIFDAEILLINQNIIKKSLNPSTAIKPELISVNNDKIILSVLNFSNYPIYINQLNHKKKKTITTLDSSKKLLSGKRDTIEINLPRSFENLFVSKKTKQAGFILHKHIYDLYLGYTIANTGITKYSNIIPYEAKQKIKEDLFREPIKLEEHKHIVINNKEKRITFNKDSIILSLALVIPKGYSFNLRPGMVIDIREGGKIISYSPLKFIGNKQNPITIYSSDKKGEGLLVLSEGLKSQLNYVNFNYLTFPKHGNWSVTGAVTFYESPVDLNHVSITHNSCEDALNIVRTQFTMNNSSITDTQSDAFDGDFVVGTIKNSFFDKLGNDAIDISGSNLTINKVIITNAGDKGLSAGEDSKMTINDVDISNSEIAVAGKDLSIVKIKNLKIKNTKLAFTAFQKKPEFGPSSITVDGIVMEGVETNYLIENSSSLVVDGEKVKTIQGVKDRMYGVEFGVSSDETRNSQ